MLRPDFTKMSVGELRDLLCELSGMSTEEACTITPKSSVVEKLMVYYPQPEERGMKIDSVFSQAELETGEIGTYAESNGVNTAPQRGSPEWQDYVISLLRDDECVENKGKRYPKAAGLRRLTELLLGPIISSGPMPAVCSFPNPANGGISTVMYEVVVKWGFDGEDTRRFVEIADAGPNNTPELYAVHASATASSRAAGRAFRSALLLSVNTAEEMNHSFDSMTDDMRLLDDDKVAITAVQIAGIKLGVDRQGLDLTELLKHHGYDKPLEELTKRDGSNLMLQISKYSSNGTGSVQAPDSIKVK